jgi:uncharacterized protein (DUF736 family)
MTKIGSLWSRVSRDGNTKYINGILDGANIPPGDKIQVVIFQNTQKKSAKSPDFLVYLSEPRPVAGMERGQPAPQADLFSGGGSEFGPDDDVPF